jgi:starch synthase
MRILFVASECAPYVKTGGLADVAGALPAALRALPHEGGDQPGADQGTQARAAEKGLDVRLLLPGYPGVLDGVRQVRVMRDLRGLPGLGGQDTARLLLARGIDGCPLYILDVPAFFGRPGNPYLGPDGKDWSDNAYRYAALCRTAALIGLDGDGGSGRGRWQADIMHAHDWQAGLTAAYLAHPFWPFAGAKRPGTVLTIHNLAFQGLFPSLLLGPLGLPADSFTLEGLEFHRQIGFLKAGLVYSDRLTTVSPSYANEIQSESWGFGLDGVLRARSHALDGIVNGIDAAVWNPAEDPHLVATYDAQSLERRALNKSALQVRFGLAQRPDAPLLGIVSRLTEQKGIDLIAEMLPHWVRQGGQVVALGTGSAALEQALAAAAAAFPGQVGLHIGYDEPLSHLIQGGVDVFAVPSRFEPCGLTQLYALRYGAVPLVSKVGGLADTVADATPDRLAEATATGFVFHPTQAEALGRAMDAALALYRQPEAWRRVQRTGMAVDHSWAAPARRYASLYQAALLAAARQS